mgnify:CR=1 FL=1
MEFVCIVPYAGMRSLSTLGSLLCLGFLMVCGGGEGDSEAVVDCRIEGNTCSGSFSCQMGPSGSYECVLSGEGGSQSTADCRTEGNACTGDFSCQMNADGAYECLPVKVAVKVATQFWWLLEG